jgi:hypothetical protein
MSKIGIKYFQIYPFIVFLFIINSCREEIIPPGNSAGNINQPVQSTSSNSYSFVINADRISNSITDYFSIFSGKSRLFFSINGYVSGSVQISVFNDQNDSFFQETLSQNITGVSVDFDEKIPNSIVLSFYNFTGKLKVQLTKLD